MKTISTALRNHYAQGSTTLAHCVRLERTDGFILTVNGSTRTFDYLGETYEARWGMAPSAVSTDAALTVQNSEMAGPLAADTVTEDEIRAGLWDGCKFAIFEVNYRDLTAGRLSMQSGTLGNVSTNRAAFNAEARSLAQYLQQTVGDVYTANCRWDLGDANCGVDLGPITAVGTLDSVTSRSNFGSSERTEPSDWFGGGVIRFDTGDNAGFSMEIAEYEPGVFGLPLPMPNNPQIGDTYSVTPGCRKRHSRRLSNPTGVSDCIDKFNNIIRFGGFPLLPGNLKTLGLGGTEGSNL